MLCIFIKSFALSWSRPELEKLGTCSLGRPAACSLQPFQGGWGNHPVVSPPFSVCREAAQSSPGSFHFDDLWPLLDIAWMTGSL